jgi:hypothetical protein
MAQKNLNLRTAPAPRRRSSSVGRFCLATWLTYAASATGCFRDPLGANQGRDAAPGGSTGAGGVAVVGGANSTGGLSVGGALGTGGASGIWTSIVAGTTTTVGGTVNAGGMLGGSSTVLVGGSVTGGAGGVFHGTGGSGAGGSIVGGIGLGGVRGTGGATAGGSATGGSIADGGINTAPDATGLILDTRSADLPSYSDFYALMTGTWLVGWSGGSRHYSWVRLSGSPSWKAEFLSGDDLPSNSPFWPCNGQGTWFPPESPWAIMLRLPSSCSSSLQTLFMFKGLPDSLPLRSGATFGMISPSAISTQPTTEWWKYPDDQCNGTMSSCTSPF